MSLSKKIFPKSAAAAAFDPLANFETVLYTGNGSTKKVNGYIRKGVGGFTNARYITLPPNSALSATTNDDFAISLFFNLDSIPTSTNFHALFGSPLSTQIPMLRVLFRGHGSNQASFEVLRGINGTYYYGATADMEATKTTFSTNTWYHLLINYTAGATKTVQIFLNNVSLGSYNLTSSASATTATQIVLGTYIVGHSSNISWLGRVDQLRIFDTPITSSFNRDTLKDEDYDQPTKSTTDIFGDGSAVALYEFEEDALSSNFGQAASFNGSSSYIDTNYTLPTDSTMSFSFWVNVSAFGSGDTYIMSDLSSSATDRRLDFRFNSSGHFNVDVGNGSSNDAGNTDGVVQSTNTWIHFVVVLNGTSLKVYKGGNSTPIIDETLTVAFGTAGARSLNLGRAGDYNGGYFNGKIDQVRIFNTALGSSDVTKLYNESSQIPTANLIAHYKLDGNAEDVLDTYDGTATNITYTNGVYGGTATNVDFLGMAFQPDLVWVKNRDTTGHHALFDSVRGEHYIIYSNLPNEEAINTSFHLDSFDTNGFTMIGNSNATNSANNFVGWAWKAGGTAVSGTGTNVTNVLVSANQEAGFSIVKYTGSNSAESYNHGLSQAPEFIITKNLDAVDRWYCYHKDIGTGKYILLDDGAVPVPYAAAYSSITSTTVANDVNNGTNDLIAYHFHSVDNYQRIGSYTGKAYPNRVYTTDNAQASGAGGFKPRFLLIKNATTGSTSWTILDTQRDGETDNNNAIFANSNIAEWGPSNTTIRIDMNEDGFTITDNNYVVVNAINDTYIYLAIA